MSYRCVRVVEEILKVISLLCELLRHNLGNCRYVRMIVRLELHQFPETAFNSPSGHRIGLLS